jgi:hypothetical protein
MAPVLGFRRWRRGHEPASFEKLAVSRRWRDTEAMAESSPPDGRDSLPEASAVLQITVSTQPGRGPSDWVARVGPSSGARLVMIAVLVVASFFVAWQEGSGTAPRHFSHAAQARSVGVVAVEPSTQYGRRIVLNGWDLPRAYIK